MNECKLYGILAEKIGEKINVAENVTDTDQLRVFAESKFLFLKEINYLIAVNRKIVKANQPLDKGDDIALLPPFAGG